MPIDFQQDFQQFHLYNDEMSYVFCILENGHLGQLYAGKRISEVQDYRYLLEERYRPLTSYVYEDNDGFSLQHTPQEYPCLGTGDVLLPAFTLRQSDGSRLSDFRYQSHEIVNGKPKIKGLPQTYVEEDTEAETLKIDLWDMVSQTRLCLSYTIYQQYSALVRQAGFVQLGEEAVVLERALSMSLDLPDTSYHWLHLDGAWTRERHIKEQPVQAGCQSIYSLKGSSSAEHNPFIALKRPDTTEHRGEVWGFSLLYSGNFLAQVDVTPFDRSRVTMGIHPEGFSWTLRQGETFQTPEVVLVYSDQGLNGMSQTYHHLYNERLVRGHWRGKERPVLLNNWEGMEFDFTEERILSLIDDAAAVGVELFVLDDGWFGKRYNEKTSLGDWVVNREKLPSGLVGIIESVKAKGMRFGLWIEPEMISKDSDLYRAHPDWVLHHPKRSQSTGRYQYVLDLSREDVYQNIHQQLHTLLSQNAIDYIKWDMNRYLTEVYSAYFGEDQQGEIFHRYVLQLYRLYEALTSEFPHVLFESCSSGGGRFDPGMLYYAPQAWTSDDTDAMERLKIQYGTSIVYPLSSMTCHVSAVPNHLTHRKTSLQTRAQVAYFGNFGYELELGRLTTEERKEIVEEIRFYKAHRKVFQYGKFSRLYSPFNGNLTAWQVLSQDGREVFVGCYQMLTQTNGVSQRLRLVDLDATAFYRLDQKVYSGSELMQIGLVIQPEELASDCSSICYYLEKM